MFVLFSLPFTIILFIFIFANLHDYHFHLQFFVEISYVNFVSSLYLLLNIDIPQDFVYTHSAISQNTISYFPTFSSLFLKTTSQISNPPFSPISSSYVPFKADYHKLWQVIISVYFDVIFSIMFLI